jgi:hypothetical protein
LKGKKRKNQPVSKLQKAKIDSHKERKTIALSTARLRKKVILIKLEELMGQHYNTW